QYQCIGVVEGRTELLLQQMRARVAMGLKYDHQTGLGPYRFGSTECLANLLRMVAIIVHHSDTVAYSVHFKASVHTTELRQGFSDRRQWHVQFHPYGNGGQGIGDVVRARQIERELPESRASTEDVKARTCTGKTHVACYVIGLTGQTIGDEASMNLWYQALNVRLIQADDAATIERHFVDELGEGSLHRLQVTIEVQMFSIHGGHDTNRRRQEQERAVAFVGLSNEIRALAQFGIAPQAIQAPPDDHRGVQTAICQDRGD